MKLNLLIQCINTWDLTAIKEDTLITINDIRFSHVAKRGGYRIITKEIPSEFTLKIYAKGFMPFQMQINNLPANKIVLCELVAKEVPSNTSIITLIPPAYVILGYNYYCLAKDISVNHECITIKNPHRVNIEGRRFLLRDTANGTEEFIILGDAQDISLRTYKINEVRHNYPESTSVMLSAFHVVSETSIPMCRPATPSDIWIYESDAKKRIRI